MGFSLQSAQNAELRHHYNFRCALVMSRLYQCVTSRDSYNFRCPVVMSRLYQRVTSRDSYNFRCPVVMSRLYHRVTSLYYCPLSLYYVVFDG